VHQESDGTYGVPRITAELREAGECVNHKRVARVMRQVGLAGLRLRRRHRTTVADPAAAKAPDLIGRDFTASDTNTKYVGDITYRSRHRRPGRRRTHPRQPRRSGHTHRSRRPVHQSGLRRRLPSSRRPPVDERDRQLVGQRLAESFNATFKRKTLQGRTSWADKREARLDAFRWLNRYNTRRRHSRLGQRSPIAYETASETTSTTLTLGRVSGRDH
jgi:transposase InsO family protein